MQTLKEQIEEIKERPICRKKINAIIKREGWTLEYLWTRHSLSLSVGKQKQLKKMIYEKGNPENLTLTNKDRDLKDIIKRWNETHGG